MDIGAAANMLTAWIANVHVETAPIRIADMQDVNRAKERDGIGFASSGAAASIGRLCVHEAAHGVVGCKLGLRPGRVCVRADGSGSAIYEGDEDAAVWMAVTHVAGVAAELVILGADDERQFVLAHSHDVLAARLAIDEPAGVVPDGFSAKVVAQIAVCAVTEHRPSIERVAQCLRVLGELSGAEVAALCGAPQ